MDREGCKELIQVFFGGEPKPRPAMDRSAAGLPSTKATVNWPAFIAEMISAPLHHRSMGIAVHTVGVNVNHPWRWRPDIPHEFVEFGVSMAEGKSSLK
jgi:hypothetical protein